MFTYSKMWINLEAINGKNLFSKLISFLKHPVHVHFRNNFVLSFAFCFDLEDERYHFALSQPYSWSRNCQYVEELGGAQHEFLKVEQIGKSIQGRPLHMLTITDPQNLEPRAKSRSSTIKANSDNEGDGPDLEVNKDDGDDDVDDVDQSGEKDDDEKEAEKFLNEVKEEISESEVDFHS